MSLFKFVSLLNNSKAIFSVVSNPTLFADMSTGLPLSNSRAPHFSLFLILLFLFSAEGSWTALLHEESV